MKTKLSIRTLMLIVPTAQLRTPVLASLGTVILLLPFVNSSFAQVETAETDIVTPDPIQMAIISVFRLVQSGPGDIAVLVSLVMLLVCAWRKLYRMATGFLILLLGTVLLRVLISLFFGPV